MTAADPRAVLTAMIERTAAELETLGARDAVSWRFAKAWLSLARFEAHTHASEDLGAALADFDALPSGLPERPMLAAMIAVSTLRHGIPYDATDTVARLVALADIVDAAPPPLPDWPYASAVIRVRDVIDASMHGRAGFQLREALAEVERLAKVVGTAQPYATMIDSLRQGLDWQRRLEESDRSSAPAAEGSEDFARRVAEFADSLPDQDGTGPAVKAGIDASLPVFRILQTLQSAMLRSDIRAMAAGLKKLEAAAEQLPADSPSRQSVDRCIAALGPFASMLNEGEAAQAKPWEPAARFAKPLPDDMLKVMEAAADRPGLGPSERVLHRFNLAIAFLSQDTPEAVDHAVTNLRQVLADASPDDRRLPAYLLGAGGAAIRRFEQRREPQDLREGIRLLEDCQARAGATSQYLWTNAAMPLAFAYRLAGRTALGRSTALDGLRGLLWDVLLQHDVEAMHSAARSAADTALDVARWCLADHDTESAVHAMESGRTQAVFASVETRTLKDRLLAQGNEELAAEWDHAHLTADEALISGGLRRRVISALAGIALDDRGFPIGSPGSATTRLLDPPSIHEIRAALRTLDVDALVYLLPGDEQSGACVIVPADGPADQLFLPGLNWKALADFDDYVASSAFDGMGVQVPAHESRDAAEAAEGAGPRTRDQSRPARAAAVDDVCDWAWNAAMRPLLALWPDRSADRPVRLVVVPMRELTRVPWHAARDRTGGRETYVIERAVISYAPSARLLCDVAARGAVPLTDSGLFVGDPDTRGAASDLPAARAEALAVKEVFYPRARYVGREADGTAAAAGAGRKPDVLAWLADPDGGPVVHLACHGVVRAATLSGDSSYFLLADGERLAAEELVGSLSHGRPRDLALAVLAACGSAESGRGYDEVFSLATAFLAHGARSVVSSQWAVPDADTSVLMFMVHHYLRHEGLPPADALRAAQLWMLHDRTPPDTMPQQLRENLRAQQPPVAAWAAFIHSGR
ncbi:CHAT domain-containing protein [Catenulispora rubra]|uniref:CHAT domain-containing protein n=1 Tax=Catenulispora rubra TaxID=280293 RepID=UPI0018921B6B|nr:CHAT domain-containing protein [Catenulispora rubra]